MPGPRDDLQGTVKEYGRHVLVCTGRNDWPERVEDEDSLLGAIARDVNALADAVQPKPKATALATPPTGTRGLDLIVYPEGVRYRNVDADAWARIRDEHLTAGRVADALDPEHLAGSDVLVCVHGARDARCGACGPLLLGVLRKTLDAEGFTEAAGERAVRVHATSHVGGHKFAGNVIVYPGGAWYGYVTPTAVEAFVRAHFVNGEAWTPHLRGFGCRLAATE